MKSNFNAKRYFCLKKKKAVSSQQTIYAKNEFFGTPFPVVLTVFDTSEQLLLRCLIMLNDSQRNVGSKNSFHCFSVKELFGFCNAS